LLFEIALTVLSTVCSSLHIALSCAMTLPCMLLYIFAGTFIT